MELVFQWQIVQSSKLSLAEKSLVQNLLFLDVVEGTSVVLLVVYELLCPLCESAPLLPLPLQSLLRLFALVNLHSGKRQTQQQRLQRQNVEQHRDVVQGLEEKRREDCD